MAFRGQLFYEAIEIITFRELNRKTKTIHQPNYVLLISALTPVCK